MTEKTAQDQPAALYTVDLSLDDTLLLWQLVSAKQTAVPLSDAAAGAAMFAKIKAAALAHGIIKT